MFTDIIQANKEKFLQFNGIKYERFHQLLPNPHIKRVLCTIPYLLSVNNDKFPGYVREPVPVGVSNFILDEDTKRFIKGKFPAAKTDLIINHPFVEMIAVMGSVGTIAYNKKSDFDYWVCINKNAVSEQEYFSFRTKAELVQKWAEAEISLPVHLFINDIESIKKNIYDEDEDEAFGSAIGALLKDEFFRSSIIVAGKIPFWWVVPQFTKDEEYETLFEKLSDDEKQNQYIDIGNLHRISREDFMGAALFQIIKSLGNPFKSILKLGVLEKYLTGKEDEPLICQKVKVSVQRGNITNTILDSYLLMFREVYDYYDSKLEDKSLLLILRQNLYLKIDPQLSKYTGIKDSKNIPYKVEEMFRYTQEWNWSPDFVRDLDNFDNWDFNKVMKFWDSVQKFMLLSYQKITTQFPFMDLKNKISESDFTLMSRKIKSHFSRETDKIEKFVSFKDTACESILYIEPVNQGIREVEWRLFKRNNAETKVFVATTIKTDSNLVKLLVWSALNGVYDPKFSRLTVQSGYTRINQNLALEMLNQLATFFNSGNLKIKNKYILKPAFALRNFIILNFNQTKAESILQFTHLYLTSWGESYIKEYSSQEDLARMLISIIKDGFILKKPFDEYCGIYAPEPYLKLYKDYISVFKDAYTTLVGNTSELPARYIGKFGSSYISITRVNSEFEAGLYPNVIKLATAVTLKPRKNISYTITDCEDTTLRVFNEIKQLTDKNGITIFSEIKGELVFGYLFNETGNLFIYYKPKAMADQFISYLYAFSKSVSKKIQEADKYSMLSPDRVKVKAISYDRSGKMSIRDDTTAASDRYLSKYGPECGYSVMVRKNQRGELVYNMAFPDKSETGFISSKDLTPAVQKLDRYKAMNSKVRNFIQDVSFGETTLSIKDSSIYFLEKYKLEFIIDKMAKKD
jgi:adenylate cyclase class 1